MFLSHPVGAADVKPLEPRHGGFGEDPRFAAVEEDGLDHRLIESGCDKRQNVLTFEDLPDASPSSTGFAHLGANCLDVVVVLGQKASQVLEHLDSFQDVAFHQKLLPQG